MAMPARDDIPLGVGLLDKAFQLLDLFTPEAPTWKQAELSRAAGLPKSTVNRLVRFFRARGYLILLPGDGRYALGPAATDLGRRATASFGLAELARPVLERLAAEHRETVILAAWDPGAGAVVCVDQIPGAAEGLRVFHSIGSSFPLHAGATSKAVLAFLPEAVQEAVLKGPLPAVTRKTVSDPGRLARDLEAIRELGYATTREETYPGVFGVAAPIFRSPGTVVGSLAMGVPLHRAGPAAIAQFVRDVRAAAAETSALLGAPPREAPRMRRTG